MSSSFPGPLWEVVAPMGGTAAVSNQHLFLNVPGGSNHDTLHPSNQAVRVVQPIGDQSFDVLNSGAPREIPQRFQSRLSDSHLEIYGL